MAPAFILDSIMARAPNGQHNGSPHPSRRLRFDDFVSTFTRKDPGSRESDGSLIEERGPGHSGRLFVVVAVAVVLLTWGGLYFAFQRWRANYRERVAYGASRMVSAASALKKVAPPDVDPVAWRDAVDRTHAMLLTVVASNLLDQTDMDKLRFEFDQSIERIRAHPETATTELAAIWNEMADRAEFLFQDSRNPTKSRHPRPAILPERPKKAPRAAKANLARDSH